MYNKNLNKNYLSDKKNKEDLTREILKDEDEIYDVESYLRAEEDKPEPKKEEDKSDETSEKDSGGKDSKSSDSDGQDEAEEFGFGDSSGGGDGGDGESNEEEDSGPSEEDMAAEFMSNVTKVYGLKKIYIKLNTLLNFLYEQNLDEYRKITQVTEELMMMFKIVASNIDKYGDRVEKIILTYNKMLNYIANYIEIKTEGGDL